MKTRPETTPTLCPLPPRAFRATDGEHRTENEKSPPRLPGLPRAEAEPQPEKFSEPDTIPFCSHPSFSYLWITWPDFISTYPSASASAPTATSTKASTCAAWTLFWSPCTANWTPGGNIWAANRCVTPAYLAALRRAGVNRLSVGIQSFDDACLKLMNRRHNAAQAVEAVRSAQREGYENITVDLIFGVPGFGDDTLRRSLDSALALGVQHISAYHLTVEPGTAFGRRAARGQFAPVDEATSETEYALVHETLTGAGFEHYEVSNFALPGFRARHNAAYWHGVKYLGIGPAAHSFDGRERHWNVASVTEYIGGTPAEAETLTDRDRFNEYVMTRLRTAEGIDLREAERLFGKERAARVLRDAEPWLKSRTLVLAAGRMAVPPARMLVSDAVIETFFETEPDTATK